MIKINDLTFEYFDRDEDGDLTEMINAIKGINFNVKKGEFVAITGRNGSGKSTFARILNRLLVPIEGTVFIDGLDGLDGDNTFEIRKKVGMVFQNPDNQLIGSIVAEDVAFGAENIGVPHNELWDRVCMAIKKAGLKDAKIVANKPISQLSGGEKQKVALAGVLAMKPECIVLDEVTSMLDPKSRYDVLEAIKSLNKEEGITVIMITHVMEELVYADRVVVMDKGCIAMQGRCQEIFENEEKLKSLGLELPACARIPKLLYKYNAISKDSIYKAEDLALAIKSRFPNKFYSDTKLQVVEKTNIAVKPQRAILVDKISCGYGRNKVLSDVSFSIGQGEYVAIVGATGSGKTTLLKHLPGLMKPLKGQIYVDGANLWDKTTDINKIRCKIGYIFQYPEQQLFAKNVFEDVVFGPRNVGVGELEAEKRAYESIKLVGLPEDVYDISVDKLSGGQKRRVALAGVLAMQPDYLILDEPCAGLDPAMKNDMLKLINALNKEAKITIIMISHDTEAIVKYADKILNVEAGAVTENGNAVSGLYNIYAGNAEENLPFSMRLLVELRKNGLPVDCLKAQDEECVEEIINCLR